MSSIGLHTREITDLIDTDRALRSHWADIRAFFADEDREQVIETLELYFAVLGHQRENVAKIAQRLKEVGQ